MALLGVTHIVAARSPRNSTTPDVTAEVDQQVDQCVASAGEDSVVRDRRREKTSLDTQGRGKPSRLPFDLAVTHT